MTLLPFRISATGRGTWTCRAALLLLLHLVLLPTNAWADSRSLSYVLSSGPSTVGRRDFEIRYLPGESGEIEIVQAWTEFSIEMGVIHYAWRQRLGGRLGSARSFSSFLEENGQPREVQGYLSSEGQWIVTVVEGKQSKTWKLDGAAIDLTSMELLDPDRGLATIQRVDWLRVLATESGAILEGPVSELASAEMQVGGARVLVRRFKWSSSSGEMILAYEDQGVLVGYDITVLRQPMSARLSTPPPVRTWDDALPPSLTDTTITEDGL